MADFKHFPKELVKFYEDLAKNNNKVWFEENRKTYEDYVLTPAKSFVETLGAKLKKLVPDLTYSPKINGSIFKIFKDARYAKGAPFKTNLGIFFWEGEGRLESSGFYFGVNPPFYFCGTGNYCFDKDTLREYREILLDKKRAPEFLNIINEMKKNYFTVEGIKRKSMPRGIKSDGAEAEYLLYDSVYINDETPINKDFYSDSFADNLYETFVKMVPFHNFTMKMIKAARAKKPKDIK